MIISIILVSVLAIVAIIALLRSVKGSDRLRDQIARLSTDAAAAQTALAAANDSIAKEREKSAGLEAQLKSARESMATQLATNSRLEERIRFNEEEKKRLSEENELRFKALANQIFTENSRTFKEQHESRLSEILSPLKENLDKFQKTVAESYSNEARERFSLQEKIKELMELNQSIGQEAKELALALRGNSKTQGDWGEMILQTILEKSGLKEGEEFIVQATTDDNGNTLRGADGHLIRPDVIIKYPGGRSVVVDSKVSLSAYVAWVNADDPDDKERFGRQHIASVRSHIKELAQKDYQRYVGDGNTDFVMMFIPNEGAYIAAMQIDNSIWQEAYDQRVLIVSPTHLISALKLILQLWQHDRMTKNVIDIATMGGSMYDKFVGFVEDMQRIDKALSSTKDAYDKAMNKLSTGRGNLVGRAEKLRKMGAKATKALPSQFTQSETDDTDDSDDTDE